MKVLEGVFHSFKTIVTCSIQGEQHFLTSNATAVDLIEDSGLVCLKSADTRQTEHCFPFQYPCAQ